MDDITVVIPTSPIPSHPDTKIIEETLSTVRVHLPDSEIILMIDGVREEQKQMFDDYQEYIRRLLWLSSQHNCYPVIFDEHQHQANMLRQTLEHIHTPLLLFVEHDTPLTPDREIDWSGITKAIIEGSADIVRLHHEALILDVHKHLMFDDEPKLVGTGLVPMMRTQQWSSRPHVSSVAYYRRILNDYFSLDSKTFIEDRMYGIVEQACRNDGVQGWYNHRIWIYTPDGDIKRSYTTDGRAGEEKFDDKLIF